MFSPKSTSSTRNITSSKFNIPAGAKVSGSCVPYASEYTDCNKDNQCTGCTRCTCSPDANWVCKRVRECPREYDSIDESSVDNAFNSLLHEFHSKNNHEETLEQISTAKPGESILVADKKDELDLEGEILSLLREKRSLSKKDKEGKRKANDIDVDKKTTNSTEPEYNGTITFYNTVDELNEDTLKNSNVSGTLEARKVDINIPSRRSDMLKDNATFENDLQIEYIKPQNYHQAIDNKIDSNHSENGIDLLEQAKIGIITNMTQQEKDKDLSKVVVNELKVGSEYIGDRKAPVMSNITFTPENDTLTAMAFIAGNLLNKLWDMEKEASDEALEFEAMKNEKLQDLLELFKEPLTMRQEAFLKNALESLSKAMDNYKDAKNISICESINEAKKFIKEAESMSWERSDVKIPEIQNKTNQPVKQSQDTTAQAVNKMNNILGLMKKYESVQKQLIYVKNKNGKSGDEFINNFLRSGGDYIENATENNNSSLSLFGKVLEKITKLLLPYKTNKKIIHKIRKMNMLVNNDHVIKKKIKDIFNTDVGNETLTMKDRIILDYLSKVKKNPKILEDSSDEGSSYAEKDILLNLSEFFKMKSLVDLVKMLDVDKKPIREHNLRSKVTTNKPQMTTEITSTINTDSTSESNIKHLETSTLESPKKFFNTKDRFKAHLKTILDDLVELHKEAGHPGKDIDFANALPCIYNMLKGSDVFNTSSPSVDPYKKLSQVFEDLKKEYKVASTAITRRMNRKELIDMSRRMPKSALVWERVVKNVDKQQNQNARRNSEIKAPTPIKELLKRLEKIEALSSVNSDLVIKKTLDPTERLMLLKAFHAENQRNFDSLKDIKASLELILSLPKEQQEDINDFVYKSAKKTNFHKKVLQYIEQNKNVKTVQATVAGKRIEIENKAINVEKPSAKLITDQKENKIDTKEVNTRVKTIKLTRDVVMNQLIKNRVSAYLKSIQGKTDIKNDPNYNIAKSIMLNIDSGNSHLAKQLYKIFVTSKKQTSQNAVSDKSLNEKLFNDKLFNDQLKAEKSLPVPDAAPPLPQLSDMLANVRRQAMFDKQPLIHFEDPRFLGKDHVVATRREQMLKSMLASKNLKYNI